MAVESIKKVGEKSSEIAHFLKSPALLDKKKRQGNPHNQI